MPKIMPPHLLDDLEEKLTAAANNLREHGGPTEVTVSLSVKLKLDEDSQVGADFTLKDAHTKKGYWVVADEDQLALDFDPATEKVRFSVDDDGVLIAEREAREALAGGVAA